MSLQSCLYVGTLRHRRHAPRVNAFQYPLFMLYLDLDELPRVFERRWLWSTCRPAPAWFRRADYLGPADQPLAEAVRDLVHARTGRRPCGPVRLLTHLRYFGYCFNPVSFYYVFEEDGRRLQALVAEITNTPWGERHAYVLPVRPGRDESALEHAWDFTKRFHVSPFMPLEQDYHWRIRLPGERLLVHMQNREHGGRTFDATLALQRRPLDGRQLALALVRWPAMTAAVIARIYWQALKLKRRGVPVHPHPDAAGA